MAAPKATTSSGLTPFEGALPKKCSTAACIIGILVDPPTKITSSISFTVKPAFFNAFLHGAMVRSTMVEINCSNLAFVKVLTKCFGIPLTGIM